MTGDATSATSGTPGNATHDAPAGDIVTITEAARLLGISVRTVQRRLDAGTLEAVEDEGKRLVRLPSDATAQAIGYTSHDAPGMSSGTPHGATGNTTAQATTAASDATRDASGELVAELRDQVKFLRSQVEEHARAEAELRAALREALRMQAKALPEPGQETAQTAPAQEVKSAQESTQTSAQQPTAQREYRPLWKLLLGIK
jgi:excisionase family DNA binding protein